jgi:putative membrane protein
MLVMMLGWAALLGIGVWAVVALTRGQSRSNPPPRSEPPREILDRRLAAGEITSQEYLEARQLLQTSSAPPTTPA